MIEKTRDYRRINRIAIKKPVYTNDEWIFLINCEKGEDIGLLEFERDRDGYRVHMGMSIKCRGAKAVESLKMAVDWIFKNTKAKAVYASIPEENKKASVVAIQAGFLYTKTENYYRFYEVTRWGN